MNAFDRIAGYKKEKEELKTLVEIFNNKEKYLSKGATLPRGIIFYGPPGTGKTLFAQILAEECSFKTININFSDSESNNSICKNIRKAFLQGAKSKEPIMIFFDELDKILPDDRENYHTDRSKTILALLLSLIDGMERAANVVFVATCNKYYALPYSLTRPGRFDKKICLTFPDYSARIEIIDLYVSATKAKFTIPTETIAKLTGGFSPASLKTLVNNCLLVSDESNRISEEILKQKISEIREEDLPTEKSDISYTIDATRNLGSFVVAKTMNDSDYLLTVDNGTVCNSYLNELIHEVSDDFRSENEDEDYSSDDDDEDEDDDEDFDFAYDIDDICDSTNDYYSTTDHISAITALLGGYVAEEMLFNTVYDNIQPNLLAIEEIFFKMARTGMFGINLYYNDYEPDRYSRKTLQRLNDTTDKIKLSCYEKAKEVVEKNLTLIKSLVPILVQQKTIEKADCEKLLNDFGGIVE